MENTEKRYKRGLYMVAAPKEVLEATKDDWELIEVLQSDGRPPSFLLRGEPDKASALQRARSETDAAQATYKAHMRKCGEHIQERTKAFAAAIADKETAESRASSAVEAERLARERELDLRGKMIAQEEALNLYRQEVGRARQAEIEKEAVTDGRRAIAVFLMVLACGVAMLALGCDDPCSRGGVGCPCTEHDDCAGWCTSDGCELGTKQGDWTPCLYEEARTCDEVCTDMGQSCSTACDWPFVAAAYSETDAACTLEGQPDWLSPWTVVAELHETPACAALIAAPYRSCCCLPVAT